MGIAFFREDQQPEPLAQVFLESRTMPKPLKPGNRVEWESSQGTVTGKVKKKLVKPTDIKDHHVAASPDNPEYLVESEKTGAQAAHKPDALKKVRREKGGRS